MTNQVRVVYEAAEAEGFEGTLYSLWAEMNDKQMPTHGVQGASSRMNAFPSRLLC